MGNKLSAFLCQFLCNGLGALGTLFMALLLAAPQAAAQGSPFNCDVVFYQVKNKTGVSQIVKFTSISATATPTAVYAANQGTLINSMGYNAVDNYLYGLNAVGNVGANLFRLGSTGYQDLGAITNPLPGGIAIPLTFTPTAGVFDAAGRYYFAGQGGGNITPTAIFRVDTVPISTGGGAQVAHQYNLTPTAVINMGDFDFNGAGGPAGFLLGATGTNAYRITLQPNSSNPALGTAMVDVQALAPGSTGTTTVGAVGSAFYDAFAGRFYVFDNNNNVFSEIINPQTGTPSPNPTAAVAFIGLAPFDVTSGVSPTDGTSCPISGVRKADLRITKTDNITSIPTGGVTSYVITVANNGPYPANYSVIQDPASAGLNKLSVTCAASAGPPTAVCPATLSVASLEAGVQIITFPPTTSLTFTVNAQVTQTAGNFVTNTATITPAVDTTLITPTFTVAIDVDAVTAANSTVVSTPSFCPAGTTESLTNLLSNGDFSAAAPLGTEATNSGLQNTYTVANSVNRQTGTAAYFGATGILQNQFPGDSSARSVPGTSNWLLSNGKTAALPNYSVWTQAVTGLTVGRTYEFMAFVSNATKPGSASPTLPNLSLQVSASGVTTTLKTFSPANETVIGGDVWTLVQGSFTAVVGGTASLNIANIAGASAEPGGGDVAAIAQVTLRACNPAADVAVTKTNGTNTLSSGGTTSYTITVVNLTAGVNATSTLIVDPAVANLAKNTITCVATAGSSCPASLSIVGFETSGLTMPLIIALGTVTFNVAASVTGPPGNTATNIVTVSSSSYTDPNPANNQAQDSDPIFGTASLSVTKTNGGSTVTAGGTTTYTVTVSVTAGAQVVGAVLKDPAAAGLSCTSVSCVSVIGAASCPSAVSVTIAALQSTGIVLPSMSSPSSIIFAMICGVSATGQ